MKFVYTGERCHHPGTGLELVPGEMEVTDEQAKQLVGILNPAAITKLGDAYFAAGADVHHTNPGCQVGNNIEPENRRLGTGELPLCSVCGGKTEAAPRRPRRG